MTPTKIPIWLHALEFPKELENLGLMLLSVSSREYQVRVWAKEEGPEFQWFDESYFNVELQTDCFKSDIRKGKYKLTKEQIKAVLKVLVMYRLFDRKPKIKPFPEDHFEAEMAIIDDPYFEKIRKQAAYAASLIKLPEPRSKDDK